MTQQLRVVHYLNQFFGGIGGEEKASEGLQVKDGLVGLGRVVQDALKERGKVVATVICGDNYFAEKMDEATQEVIKLLTPYRPDVVIAGPALNAGRYGVACGAVCKAVQEKVGIYTKDLRYICHWIERPEMANRERAKIEESIKKEKPGASEQEIRILMGERTRARYPAWQQESIKEIRQMLAKKLGI